MLEKNFKHHKLRKLELQFSDKLYLTHWFPNFTVTTLKFESFSRPCKYESIRSFCINYRKWWNLARKIHIIIKYYLLMWKSINQNLLFVRKTVFNNECIIENKVKKSMQSMAFCINHTEPVSRLMRFRFQIQITFCAIF